MLTHLEVPTFVVFTKRFSFENKERWKTKNEIIKNIVCVTFHSKREPPNEQKKFGDPLKYPIKLQ
jgi:hypothetical protein